MTLIETDKIRVFAKDAKKLGFEGLSIITPVEMISEATKNFLVDNLGDLGTISTKTEELSYDSILKSKAQTVGIIEISWTKKPRKRSMFSITTIEYIMKHVPQKDTVTVEFELDEDIKIEAEKVLRQYNLTLEQAINMFLEWTIANPKEAKEYLTQN